MEFCDQLDHQSVKSHQYHLDCRSSASQTSFLEGVLGDHTQINQRKLDVKADGLHSPASSACLARGMHRKPQKDANQTK